MILSEVWSFKVYFLNRCEDEPALISPDIRSPDASQSRPPRAPCRQQTCVPVTEPRAVLSLLVRHSTPSPWHLMLQHCLRFTCPLLWRLKVTVIKTSFVSCTEGSHKALGGARALVWSPRAAGFCRYLFSAFPGKRHFPSVFQMGNLLLVIL